MGEYRELPSNFTVDMILKIPSRNIMNKLARSVLVLYSYDDLAEDISAPNVLRQCLQLIALFPVLSAYGYQAIRRYFENKSLFLHNPDPKLSTAENFLRLTRVDGNFTPLEAELLDQLLIVHAEHGGGNNSAFTMHVVTSSATDTYSAFAAAVGSLKGSRHGGASLQVKSMMDDLMKTCGSSPDETRIASYIDALLDRKAFDESGLIYGMGHAVYTQSDPRAVILREKARQLAEERICSINSRCTLPLSVLPRRYSIAKKESPNRFVRMSTSIQGSSTACSASPSTYIRLFLRLPAWLAGLPIGSNSLSPAGKSFGRAPIRARLNVEATSRWQTAYKNHSVPDVM
jgi:citrate synthase